MTTQKEMASDNITGWPTYMVNMELSCYWGTVTIVYFQQHFYYTTTTCCHICFSATASVVTCLSAHWFCWCYFCHCPLHSACMCSLTTCSHLQLLQPVTEVQPSYCRTCLHTPFTVVVHILQVPPPHLVVHLPYFETTCLLLLSTNSFTVLYGSQISIGSPTCSPSVFDSPSTTLLPILQVPTVNKNKKKTFLCPCKVQNFLNFQSLCSRCDFWLFSGEWSSYLNVTLPMNS